MAYQQEYIKLHPGVLFKNKVLKARNLTIKEAAKTLEVSTAYLDDFVKGYRNLWETLAHNIENQYDIKAKDLRELQQKYDEETR